MTEDESARSKRAQYAYLDLLATTLTEHEKTLDKLIAKLEEISKNLAKLSKVAELKEEVEPEVTVKKMENLETLTYLKIKLSRPINELKEILKSLKD